jgi:magnesium-transporting ATPase (P-type)
MIIYFFYKNFVFTLVHFFYAFFNLSSGQSIIDDWFITFYNLVFTSLPLGVRACTDFDLLPTDGKLVNEMLPFLYKESIITEEFNYKKIVFYLSKGLLISFINFIIIEKCVGNNILNSKGDPENLWFDSFILYTNIIINVSITLLTLVKYFTFLMPLIMGIFTFLIYIIFCLIGDKYLNFNSKSTIINSLKCPSFYLILILVCFLNFMLDYFIYNFKFFFNLSMSSLLFHLFINNELDNPIEKLPNLIKNAKKSIEIINKYNNFNMIKDNSYYSQTKLFKSMGEESKKYFRANSDNFINFVFKKKKNFF